MHIFSILETLVNVVNVLDIDFLQWSSSISESERSLVDGLTLVQFVGMNFVPIKLSHLGRSLIDVVSANRFLFAPIMITEFTLAHNGLRVILHTFV